MRQFADFGADVIKVESPPGVDLNEAWAGRATAPTCRTCTATNAR